MPVLLDFESRSRCDLRKRGGRLYWEDPSSEALCAVYCDTETGEVDAWFPGQPIPWCVYTKPLAAHNGRGFDRFATLKYWGVDIEIDTSELARTAGLPGALDALGTRWLGIPKDKEASRFTKALSRPSRARATAGQLPPITPEVMQRVVAYCASDVEIMAHGWPLLESWADLEPDVQRADRNVNDRGVAFDVQLAKRLLECDAINAERAIEDAARTLGWTPATTRDVARSPQQFCEWTGLPDAQKPTIDAVLADPTEDPRVQALATARRALASIARGKLEAGLLRVSADGRLRDMLRYYGAHTGRWSGRGMQLHNMPRPAKRFEEWGDAEICALADRVLAGKHVATPEEIDLLLRATITAAPGRVLVVCDFAGVEARGLAWCAGDAGALDVFASGRDPYRVAAATIFGTTYDAIPKSDVRRNAGKMAELACGYQGGPAALERIARANGVDLASTGADPDEIVQGWRTLHRPCVNFWYAMQRAWASAARGTPASVACFDFVPSDDGRDVACFLPSGRPIVYNDARVGVGPSGRDQLSYHGHRGREHTYGGKLVENAIQALCRDLMARALVQAEAAGLRPVLHVHDEIVCEVPAQAEAEGAALLKEIMLDLPEWAAGFPIGAAGHTGRRYRK